MTEGTAQWRSPVPPPPRTLNVTKFAHSRADELQSLHAIVSTRLHGDFRSQRSKRRRTTGYHNKAGRKRRKRDVEGVKDKERSKLDDMEEGEEKECEQKKLPRRIRRRIELKKNPNSGFVTTGDGTRRLRTHVWHAKRFTMTKLWGFHLPLGLHGSGRGSRAVLKWYKQGAVVHDSSYLSAVQLEGSEETLLTILSSILEPPPLLHSVDCSKGEHQSGCLLCGDVHGSSILHHFEESCSKVIGPVIYMWRPIHQQCRSVNVGSSNTNKDSKAHCVPSRQLWMWMHPAAFDEGYNELKSVCQKKMEEDTGNVVKCLSLEGQLVKLDVMGSKAFPLLQRILHPVTGSLKHNWIQRRCLVEETSNNACQNKQEEVLPEEDSYVTGAVVPLLVSDPRFISEKRKKTANLVGDTVCNQDVVQEQEKKQLFPPVRDAVKYGNSMLCSLSGSEKNGETLSGFSDLWDIGNGNVCQPMEESVLCSERHHRKLNLFSLKETGSELPERSQGSGYCPILLLNNAYNSGSLKGWSIVVPVSWIKAFWNPLISSGARAIGLREKHWIACDNGLPQFPLDFPDCKAYYSFKEAEAVSINEKMALRPVKVRPFRVPTLPPWCSTFILSEGSAQIEENGHSDDMKKPSMEVFVARTPNALNRFCGEAVCNQLFLRVNKTPDHTTSMVNDRVQLSKAHQWESPANQDKKVCYVRVLLHAFKEGVFEEGAVIYAPRISDIVLLRSSSEVAEARLHIPQSSLLSYFIEQVPGKWEFNRTNESIAKESYRLPLGFVTTGFVRGSKRPVALGFCEAARLAHIRQEQLTSAKIKKRKEVFVLIRNLRSNAYRLALASIVLEMQENDIEFF